MLIFKGVGMERLEPKKINGQIYYYYSKWGWVNGKCRRIWQKYLGKPADIAKAVQRGGSAPLYAEVFQWALPEALWHESQMAEVIEQTDQLCPKRDQGLSTGQYLAIAALNRAICPSSKRSMWDWFSGTCLLRHLPQSSKTTLASQRFWDHMDRIKNDKALSIWKNILAGVLKYEAIDLSRISYDGTNFYTFIDTFNMRCQLPKRGKNKQGRNNLRQLNYALFCAADGQVPLFYDVYEGNRHDAKEFPVILEKFHSFINELVGKSCAVPEITLIFDKGNNSRENFALLDSLKMPCGQALNFVGSLRMDTQKDLMEISNDDPAFVPLQAEQLHGTKAFCVKRKIYGKERVVVVTYNQNLFNAQWMTVQNDISKVMEKLGVLQQKLQDRAKGIIRGGKVPTLQSVQRQAKEILKRQHMKQVIKIEINNDTTGIPRLQYSVNTKAMHDLSQTCLGKNIIVTSRKDWDNEKIILAYRSQFTIENVFKEMKDRSTGSWWPLCHWTDSKIKVHGLYCTIALLLRALMLRRVRQAGLKMSLKRLLDELDSIREVINIYPRKRGKKTQPTQTVLTKTSQLQQELLSILSLNSEENSVLG